MWSPIDFCQSKPVQAQNLKERSERECHPVGNENNWMAGVTTGYLHQSPSQQRLHQSNTLEWGVHLFFAKDITAQPTSLHVAWGHFKSLAAQGHAIANGI